MKGFNPFRHYGNFPESKVSNFARINFLQIFANRPFLRISRLLFLAIFELVLAKFITRKKFMHAKLNPFNVLQNRLRATQVVKSVVWGLIQTS